MIGWIVFICMIFIFGVGCECIGTRNAIGVADRKPSSPYLFDITTGVPWNIAFGEVNLQYLFHPWMISFSSIVFPLIEIFFPFAKDFFPSVYILLTWW